MDHIRTCYSMVRPKQPYTNKTSNTFVLSFYDIGFRLKDSTPALKPSQTNYEMFYLYYNTFIIF